MSSFFLSWDYMVYLIFVTFHSISVVNPFALSKSKIIFFFSFILEFYTQKMFKKSHLDFSCNICNLMVSIWSMLILDKSFLFFQLCWFDVFRIIHLSGSLSVVYTASKPCHTLRLLPGKWSTNSCLWIHTQWKCINSLVW